MSEQPPKPRRRAKAPPGEKPGETYNLSGDFRGAVVNIQSTIVGAAEVRELEALPPEPGDPPYLGLQYYDEADADRFFGRELLTAKLVARLAQSRFLAVIGDSGSGKSSLVRAGGVPGLPRRQRLADDSLPPKDSPAWDILIFTPTAHPLDALAAALTREAESPTALSTLATELAGGPRALSLASRQLLARQNKPHLLLVVDQFEEVFAQCHEESERKAFIDNLLTSAAPEDSQPVTVLILLRADFYAQLAHYDQLREMVAKQQEFIGAMSRDELFRAIVQPAALGNWKIQEGLVEVILDDIGSEPGALPLLSFTLDALYAAD
nr:ATP-binding protein [Anaerolinea sp.]